MTATTTRRSNEPTQDPPARHAGWSHDWQSKWSHEPGRKPATPVPCSWQATRGSHKSFVYTKPSTKAIASIKARVKAMTYRATLHRDPGYLMAYLGRVLRGWANYFRHAVAKRAFNAVDSYTWERITSWLRKKHRRIGWPELRRRYCLPGSWRLAHDGVRFKGAASVPIVRYRYRGYQIPTPWTPSTVAS